MNFESLLSKSWKNLWRSPVVWFFTLLAIPSNISPLFLSNRSSNVLFVVFSSFRSVFEWILALFGIAGLLWIFNSYEKGEAYGIVETWNFIKPMIWQVIGAQLLIGCFTLEILFRVIFPIFFFLEAVFSIYTTGFPSITISPLSIPFFILFSQFWTLMTTIITCSIIVKKKGLSEGLRHGFRLVFSNLGRLLGICILLFGLQVLFILLFCACADVIYGSTIVINSYASLMNLYMSLSNTLSYKIFYAFYNSFMIPFTTSVITLAFLEYTKKEIHV